MKHRINYPHRPESDGQRERRMDGEAKDLAGARPDRLCKKCKEGEHNPGQWGCASQDCECRNCPKSKVPFEPDDIDPLTPDQRMRWRLSNGVR